MSLPIYVAQEKWQDFDEAWTEQMTSDQSVDDLLIAIKLAGDKKRVARCVPLARQHVELLEAAERYGDAAKVLGTILLAGAPPSEISVPLLENARKAWGEEPWWNHRVEITGLCEEAPDLRKPWGAFGKILTFEAGAIVYHPGGWGTGEISEIDEESSEIHIRFQDGRKDHFPMKGAADIFDVLPEDDLRARYFRDPENLSKRIKKEHLEILKAVVSRYHGRATLAAIKNALAQVKIEGSAWSAWWRKARKLAQNSEWFRVSGSGTRMEVRLLLTAADPVSQLQQQLSNLATLEEVVSRTRDLVDDKSSTKDLIDIALERVEELAAEDGLEEFEQLAGWMFLYEVRGEISEPLAARLAEAKAAPAPETSIEPPALWALFHLLHTSHEQERCVDLLAEIHGDQWLDDAALNLPHAAPGMVRLLVEKLAAGGKKTELADHYVKLLSRPMRSPHVLIALARMAESGKIKGDWPPPVERAQALVNLATNLWTTRRADTHLARAHTKIVELLTGGKEPVLSKLLEGAQHSDLHSVQLLLQRGVEESIDNLVTSISIHLDPGEVGASSNAFWLDDRIWTTRSGLTRYNKELEEIMQVKMPENEEAIGRAAAMGDLSENAEWEAAIEEKRNLSDRAANMMEEIRKASLLENAIVPEDTVCPGTRVRYRDLSEDKEAAIILLGPWDTDEEGQVVSYRAPLAQGMLGLHPGDRKVVSLPRGEVEVEILSIELADID